MADTAKKPANTNGHDEARSYNVIGTRPIRHDGLDKVTGRARYGADIHLPKMLHAKMLRSPHAHARFRIVDMSKAEALPGVYAIVTGADMPAVSDKIQEMGEDAVSLSHLSANILAHDKLLYHGHPIAAIAATDPHIAEEALKLIDVEYELLPPILDVRAAMQDGAPILLDDLRTDEFGRRGTEPTNVAKHLRHQRGDLAAGFAQADVIVEREFTTAMVHQGYLEPHTSTVHYKQDGHVEIWTSTQGAFNIRDQVSELLKIPVSQIKVTPMEIGGGFGGKFTAYTDAPAALLSKKSGYRPVKMTMTRAEVLLATGPTSGSYIRVKIGATKDGHITAAETTMIYEAGAYAGSPIGAGAGVIFAPYRLDNVQIDGYDVVVNKPKTSAYRAPGGTNAAFASESVINEVAEKLGMDPLEFRLINAAREDDRRPDGPIYKRIGFVETLQAAQAHQHTGAPLPEASKGALVGRGVASGFWFNGGGRSSVFASVNPDGTVKLVEGSTDIGGSRASIAMQLAETIGIAAEDVSPAVADTESIGHNDGTGGSRVTFATGYAAYELGLRLIAKMREQLADIWDVSTDQVAFDDGVFSADGHRATFKEAAAELDDESTPIVASASVRPSSPGPAFATHIVDVAVDPETGKVSILRYTAVQDVGTAIHPSYVEGQMQGGVVQGIGWALNEEYIYDAEGHLLNSTLLDYRMPTALDLPMIETVLVEVPNPGHPYGVRGVGEVPIVPPAAAVADAIYHATGRRMYTLPMSPVRVVESLWAVEGAT